MPAKYTIQLSPEDLKTIMEDPERHVVEVPVEDTEEVIVEPSEEEEIGNVAPEEAAAVAAMGFDPMTESKISSFSTFLKRK